MFDIGSTELLLIAVVALLVIGPKDLPRVLNTVGKWIAKARAMTGHIRSGLETMAREAELEDMEKQWAAHNERIKTESGDTGSLLEGEMLPLAAEPEPGEGELSQGTPSSDPDQPVLPLEERASIPPGAGL